MFSNIEPRNVVDGFNNAGFEVNETDVGDLSRVDDDAKVDPEVESERGEVFPTILDEVLTEMKQKELEEKFEKQVSYEQHFIFFVKTKGRNNLEGLFQENFPAWYNVTL
jgi:predicted transcriptional regulator